MRAIFVLVIVAILALAACENQSPAPSGQSVGLVRLNLTDSDRQNWKETAERPIVTSVWYPAEEGSKMVEIGIPPKRPVFIGGFAARNAALSQKQKTYPLILLSHGTGGAAMQMMWLARNLAEEGYIVAAVDHHGNTAAEDEFDARGFRMPWERPRDLSEVLDQLLEDPNWGPQIDLNKIGAGGFSLGGYSVTALAGGQINLNQFEAFCNGGNRDTTCDEQSEFPDAGKLFKAMLESEPTLAERMEEHYASYLDSRIQAVVVLAPALGQAFTEDSLSAIKIPYLAVVGDADKIAPPRTNAQYLAEEISSARLFVIPDAGHYVFLNKCNKRGKRYVPVCNDTPYVDRNEVHELVSAEAIEFFDNVLDK